jgi:fimbrial chaperone protein
MPFRHFGRLAALCLLTAAAAHAQVAPIAVAPVVVRLQPGTDYGQVDISNRGSLPTGLEVSMVRMRWNGSAEEYTPTGDFVFSPPSLRLEGGKNRLLRFRYVGTRGDTEAAYRLFIRQLPDDSRAPDQIVMLVNLGVPVFVDPPAARPALSLSRENDAATLRNVGNVTLTVTELAGEGCPAGAFAVGARLLPDQARPLKDKPLPCVSRALTDRGPVVLAAP